MKWVVNACGTLRALGLQSQAKSFTDKVLSAFITISHLFPFSTWSSNFNQWSYFDALNIHNWFLLWDLGSCSSCVWDSFLFFTCLVLSDICLNSDVYCSERLFALSRARKSLPDCHSSCLYKTLFCVLLSKPIFACRLVLYCLPKLEQLSMRVASSILSSDMHDLW